MKISTRGRYAVRLMADLAQNQGNGYVALKDIAERQGISKKYLEQIVTLLSRSGMLQTNRGYQGGYRLAQPAENYTLGDILRVTEGSLAPVACLDADAAPCQRAPYCITLPVWKELSALINNYLDSVTVQDLLDKQAENGAFDYVI